MREWRKKAKRILVLLLTAALIGNTVDFPVFAVSAAQNRETGLCRHHQSHTVECGYWEEDNMPCGYECRICPMEDLIAALPDEVTEDNVPLEVTSMPQKAKNSERTMLEVGSEFIYEIDGTTYNCIVVSSTSNEAAVVWKEMQNPESDLLESKQSMILSCEEKGGRLIKYAEYQVLSDYQIISLNNNFNTFGCQEYAACYCNSGYWEGDKTYSWTDWSYFIAFDLRCNSIKATENFNSEKYYDGTPFEVDTNSFTWKGAATPTVKFYSDMNGTEISAPSAIGTYYIKLSIADPVVEDGIRYEAAESDYIEITILPIITEQPESAELYYGYVAGNVLSVTVATDGVTYQWYENNSTIDGATQATYTVPAGKMVGTYQYYCKVSLGDYTEQSQIANVTVVKSGSTLESRLTVLNGETETNRFTASDTITVIATPTATGAAPAAMMVASLDAPTGGQMALFVGDTQVSEPASAGADGTYTMTASASDVLTLGQVKPNGAPITLTAKFVGNGNMADAAATVEVNISASVKVEIGNATTYYGDIRTAWTAAKGNTATVTLLADVPESMSLFVTEGDDITFDGGKFTLTGPPNNNRIFDISGGKLTVTGGTLKTGENTSVPQSFDILISGGELVVTGGSLEAGTGYVGLSVVGNVPVKLSGGTFHGIGMSTLTDTVGRLLLNYGSTNAAEKHYAYYQGDEPVDLTKLERQYVLTDTVTVAECKHTGVIPTPNDDGTHTLKCPYCGYTGTAENCSYGTEYKHDETNHTQTCVLCGYEKVEAHTINKITADVTDNVITVSEKCETCGYSDGTTLGTMTLHIPEGLTYGATKDKAVTWETNLQLSHDGLGISMDNGAERVYQESYPLPELTSGEHTLEVTVNLTVDIGNPKYAICVIPLIVAPAPLTGEMVELSGVSYTYDTTEHKPAVTIGDLAEGTDYEVAYSTANFTNAGTHTVTVTGKGNYTGTVEKTYTIAKAVPYIADPPKAAQITYGDTLDTSVLTGGMVQYSDLDSTGVTGSFTWKDGALKPAVSDSGSTEYTVVFNPSDSTNYSSVETKITLTVQQAENAPDMPSGTMNVANSCEKIGDVKLPSGWQWKDIDKDTILESGIPATATAVYTGADKDNYKNVTVTVKIVRAGSTEKPVSLTEVKIKGMDSETKKQLTVSWDKVEGADGYEVIYASNKSFTKNKVTKKTTKTSLTLKKLNEKKTWYVKVRAYAKKGTKTYTGKYSAARYIKLSQRPANVKKVTVKPGTKKLSVTAGSVKGATGYEIVVSTDKAGKKTVASKKAAKGKASFTKLGKKKTYYVTVRAYKKTKSGGYLYSAKKVTKVKTK